MIALNVVLMAVIVLLIAGVLAWAIVADRRSKRTRAMSSDAPLHHNLMMPRELRVRRMVHRRGRKSGSSTV